MIWLSAILTISSVTAAWTDSPRYASSYRFARCIPCEQRQENSFPQSNGLEYRGNGADNLGYDWSPKAWGGRAFPTKDDDKGRFPGDDWNNRDGRRMPWNEKCRDCDRSKSWGQYGDSKSNNNQYGDRNSPPFKGESFGASTDRPQSYVGNSATPSDGFSTVTSSVLGVRLRDDKRLPVEWSEDSRSMRWDGFRNGMPLHRPDNMDRRDDSYRPWEGHNQGSSSWNQDKKNHYASDWNYGERNPDIYRPNNFDQMPWANRWSNKNDGNDGQYNLGSSGKPFGSSYPHSDRYPNSPSHSTPSYPSNNRPLPDYSAGSSPNKPTYSTTSNPYISNKPQSESGPWNYRPEHPPWTTTRPQQSYLPQNNRPSNRPEYSYGQTNNQPNAGTPGTAIWHGRPYDRPSDGQKPQGFYTGFITEIHDPKYSGNGNRYPSDRPYSGNSYDKNNNDRYPGNNNQGTRFPSYNGNNYGTNYDRYPNQKPGYEWPYDGNKPSYGGNLGPSYDGKRQPGYDANRNPSYDANRNPSYDANRSPSYDANRNPSYDRNRYPNYDGMRNPNYDHNRNPSYEGNKNSGYGGSRYPSYDTRPNRYPENNNYDQSNTNSGYDYQNSYPAPNSNHDRDRDWNYGSDNRDYGQSSYNHDRDTRPSYGSGPNHNPSRPNSGDHDRGPNSGTVSGTWNYGDEDKDGSYRRSGGSYPLYKGGQYYTSSYLASASTPAAAAADPPNNKSTDETTIASSHE